MWLFFGLFREVGVCLGVFGEVGGDGTRFLYARRTGTGIGGKEVLKNFFSFMRDFTKSPIFLCFCLGVVWEVEKKGGTPKKGVTLS